MENKWRGLAKIGFILLIISFLYYIRWMMPLVFLTESMVFMIIDFWLHVISFIFAIIVLFYFGWKNRTK